MTAAVGEAPAPAPATTVAEALGGDFMSGGEIVLLAVKPSMWRMVFESAPWLVATLALSVLTLSMGSPIVGVSTSLAAQLILLIGLGRLAVAVLRWVPAWHLLTNRRLMDIRGVRTPRVSSLFLTDIAESETSATTPERLVGIGTITFTPRLADQPPRLWRSIPDHIEVHDRIRRAIREAGNAER